MALQRPGYDDSPAAASLPLTFEDLDWLVENNRNALKDIGRRQHLLARIRNTLIAYRNAINDLHREISHMQNELATPHTSTSMNPVDAARFLSDAQKEQLFVGSMKQAWTGLLRLRGEAAGLKAQANSELGRARFAIQTVLKNDALDEESRAQLATLLSRLPAAEELLLNPVPSPLGDLPDADCIRVTTTPHAGAATSDAATSDTTANDATTGDMARGSGDVSEEVTGAQRSPADPPEAAESTRSENPAGEADDELQSLFT